MIRLGVRLAFGAMILCVFCGCGSGGPTVNPTPIVSTISPEHAIAGGPAFQLNVVALNVETNSTVDWNGSPRTTTTDPNTGQLVAQILATDITTPGSAEITVVTPAPGGGISNDITFFIDAPANPAPTVSNLSPSSVAAGGAAFTLTVTGGGFINSSSVNWNGSPRATTFVNSMQLTAAILAGDIATAGTANITVTNPAPGGGTSAVAVFTISAGASVPAAKAGMFALVSATASGDPGNGPSGEPRMDQSGRFVAFESTATNLLENGTKAEVFLRDTCLATEDCTPETVGVDVTRNRRRTERRTGTRVGDQRGREIRGVLVACHESGFRAISRRAADLFARYMLGRGRIREMRAGNNINFRKFERSGWRCGE